MAEHDFYPRLHVEAGGEAGTTPSDLLHLVQQLSAGSHQLRREIATITRAWKINDTQVLLLFVCRAHHAPPGIAQRELAAAVGVSAAQMSGLVDQLRTSGLMSIQRSNTDRRRQLCQVTESGQELLDGILPQLEQLAATLEDWVSRTELHGLQQTLKRLTSPAPNSSNAAVPQRRAA